MNSTLCVLSRENTADDERGHHEIRVKYLLPTCLLLAGAGQHCVAEDWPQWGGPDRDLVWRETGIVDSLPDGRLPRMWTTPIGEGYAGPAVADGRVYLMDRIHGEARDGVERVLCLDADSGEIQWTHDYECTYTVQYPAGPRCTPTCDGNRIYTVGPWGICSAWMPTPVTSSGRRSSPRILERGYRSGVWRLRRWSTAIN